MHRLILFTLRSFCWFLGFIPSCIAIFSGRCLGRIAYHVDKKHRCIVIKNLTLAFGKNRGKEEIKRIGLRVFENLGMNLMEFGRLLRLKRHDIEGYIAYKGLEHVEKAHKKGKGAILLTAHFGNWELLAALVALKGYPLNIIVRRLDSPIIDELVEGVRTGFGIKVIDKKNSMRKAIRALQRGEMVGILLDQNVTWREGVFVDYFGRLACTNKGLALLARRSGTPVIPTFIVRESNNKHMAIFEKPIDLSITKNLTKDVVVNTAKFTRVIERFVKQYPEQWFWIHQRWKSRPEDDPGKKKKDETNIQRD